MKLEEYIKIILDISPKDVDIYFEINLDSRIFVTTEDTGLKVKFTVTNTKEK